MGNSQGHDYEGFEERSGSYSRRGMIATGPDNEQNREDRIVKTKLRKDNWTVGAQILACIHDMIRVDGPFCFVNQCIYDKEVDDEEGIHDLGLSKLAASEVVSCGQSLTHFLLAFVFLVVMPYSSPYFVAKFLVSFNWGYTKDGDMFQLHNLRFNMTRLGEAILEANATGHDPERHYAKYPRDNIGFLINQKFQEHMSDVMIQHFCGLGTLALLLFFVALRSAKCSRRNKTVKRFLVLGALNFLWCSNDYPKLQYTSNTLNVGFTKIKLYNWVPCAWLATVTSFVVVLPSISFFLDEGDFFERLDMMRRVVPSALFAAFAFGKIYMQAANASFSFWLSNESTYALVQRQFTLNPMYVALQGHFGQFAVTETEITYLANNLLMQKALLKSTRINDDVKKDLEEAGDEEDEHGPIIRSQKDGGNKDNDAWEKLQLAISGHARNNWILHTVFVKDVSANAKGQYTTIKLY